MINIKTDTGGTEMKDPIVVERQDLMTLVQTAYYEGASNQNFNLSVPKVVERLTANWPSSDTKRSLEKLLQASEPALTLEPRQWLLLFSYIQNHVDDLQSANPDIREYGVLVDQELFDDEYVDWKPTVEEYSAIAQALKAQLKPAMGDHK